jgi:hypothetical protein
VTPEETAELAEREEADIQRQMADSERRETDADPQSDP